MEENSKGKIEQLLNGKGYANVAGIDEAGRGPLAGPVVASAVIVTDWDMDISILEGVKDSKKISEKKRKILFEKIRECPQIRWGVGIVNEKIIDKINIFEATKLAMQSAVKDLSRSLQPDFLVIDGNTLIDYPIAQKAVIKADNSVFSCSAASIIAKVSRDELMLKYAEIYPNYGFEKHKGYGTKFHIDAIQQFGPCEIHRKTFNPVSLFI
jgi:ribonuclease HII